MCIFVCKLHLHFPDSKHLRGFVCHEIFGNFFRHSEIFGLHPPPPPPTIHASYGPAYISLRSRGIFLIFSLFALFVMNFDRYLATSYPIFHRTSVTKGRLLTLLAILIMVDITLGVMSVNDFVISNQVYTLILCTLVFPAMLFINYKLFLVVRKSRKNKRISPEIKKTFSFKNISSCLLVVASGVALSAPASVYIGLTINSTESRHTLDNGGLAALLNCTFNCLIFYWKNKVLRTEGLKVLKNLKIC